LKVYVYLKEITNRKRGARSLNKLKNVVDILDRARTGKPCSLKEWDVKILPTTIKNVLKKHGLEKQCDPDNYINLDTRLADRFYEAAFEFAAQMGVLCMDTERIIEVNSDELKEALASLPGKIELGAEKDQVSIVNRKPEDTNEPVWMPSLCIVVDEDLWVPLVQGMVEQPSTDILLGPSLDTVYGSPLFAGTPYETVGSIVEVQLRMEACNRAGRPHIGHCGIASNTTEYGNLGGFSLLPRHSIGICLAPVELKTTYATLHRVAHTLGHQGYVRSASHAMIGGYSGSPEGATLSAIASNLLQAFVHQASISCSYVLDIRYAGNTGPEALWANSIVCQSISQNTNIILDLMITELAGPATEMLLYECAASMLAIGSCGASCSAGPRSAGGKYRNHLTPLETGFCGELLKASAGMKMNEVAIILKDLVPYYKDHLMHPPVGSSFKECYDVDTLKPKQAWLDMYHKVKNELITMGVPLQPGHPLYK
jgi:methylamine--corrinoid protein Co-methyltransferase